MKSLDLARDERMRRTWSVGIDVVAESQEGTTVSL